MADMYMGICNHKNRHLVTVMYVCCLCFMWSTMPIYYEVQNEMKQSENEMKHYTRVLSMLHAQHNVKQCNKL